VVELNASSMVVWSYQSMLFGSLSNPQGVTRTKSGNTLVADTGNNRVIEISASHKIEKTIKFRFNHPMSVDRVDATNTTLVADTGSNRVLEVADNGTITWSVGDGTTGLLSHPAFAQRLANGNTLIADTGNHRVLEVTKDRKLAWSYGGNGERATCYLPNSAVRLSNGNTLIADTGNDRVIEVDAKGAIVWQMPTEQPLFAERL
jgi:DNA-binding beta-propeller fold protein YncE